MLFSSLSSNFFTIRGLIIIPSFAIAETAVINCSGVIAMPCPKDIVASSTGPTEDFLSSKELLSPGKSIPVLSAKPKASRYS